MSHHLKYYTIIALCHKEPDPITDEPRVISLKMIDLEPNKDVEERVKKLQKIGCYRIIAYEFDHKPSEKEKEYALRDFLQTIR